MNEVAFSKATFISRNQLIINKQFENGDLEERCKDFIHSFRVRVIYPFERDTHVNSIMDINKTEQGIETEVVGENCLVNLDARQALAMLKLKMRKGK